MERICVGDLHGDIGRYQQIKKQFPGTKITLVGDILDSFLYSRTEQYHLLIEILDDIEKGTTECVYGNHEWSYLWPERMRCSGFSGGFAAQIFPLRSRIHKLLVPMIYENQHENPILITHAGLSKQLLGNRNFKEIDDIIIFIENDNRNIDHGRTYNIGRARGGTDHCGGIYWCDFHKEFEPIKGLRQIFGHTHVQKIQEVGVENFNIDCLSSSTPQVLHVNNEGGIKIIAI